MSLQGNNFTHRKANRFWKPKVIFKTIEMYVSD